MLLLISDLSWILKFLKKLALNSFSYKSNLLHSRPVNNLSSSNLKYVFFYINIMLGSL